MSLPPILAGRLRLPVVAAPLFIISTPDLVIAQCKAGVVGSFPALNARPASALDEWLRRIRAELAEHDALHPDRPAAPFAVNQIVHRSNDRLQHDLAACVEHRVPLVITSLGARADVNDAVHGYGGIVLHDVISDRFARKAVEKGADGLIAVAAGAGGHAGTVSPFALVQRTARGPLAEMWGNRPTRRRGRRQRLLQPCTSSLPSSRRAKWHGRCRCALRTRRRASRTACGG